MRNSSPVALGQVIANKYQVEGVLGEGGMGIVVSAWHLGLEQRVAIKLLLQHMRQSDSSALERFQREARAAARIRSEHVCRVLDTGSLEDGTPFLVMEYLEGADLCEELLKRGRFEIPEAVRYVREACSALAQAHQAGVIHRDLKPANLFLVQRSDGTRTIKVLDFGVSKSISGSGVPHLTLTKTSALVGSPIYMSPEQLNSSKDVDHRTDIWALGTILYELITGRTPFYGETIPQLVNAVLNTEPEPFANLGINAPEGLEMVVRRALSKQRDMRYASAQELFAALAPFADDQGSISGIHSPRTPLPTRSMNAIDPRTPPGVSLPPTPVPQERAGGRSRKWLSTALVVAAVILMAGLAALFSRRRSSGGEDAAGQAPVAAQDAGTPRQSAPQVPAPPTRVEAAQLAVPALADQPTATSDGAVDALPTGVDQPVNGLDDRPDQGRTARDRTRSQRDAGTRSSSTREPEPRAITNDAHSDDGLSNFGGRR